MLKQYYSRHWSYTFGLFYLYGFTLLSAWINVHIHNHLSIPKLQGAAIEVWVF